MPSTLEQLRGNQTTIDSYVALPYVDLHETEITTVRIHLDNMGGTVTPAPNARQHFYLVGPKQEGTKFSGIALSNRAILGRMFNNGVHEINVRRLRTSQDKVSLGLGFRAEISAAAIYPPSVRSIELYGD